MKSYNQNQGPISKEEFLAEHNRLSPDSLQVTPALLTRFQEEQKPLLKDSGWSFKLRMPLISWLLLLPKSKAKPPKKAAAPGYKIFPFAEDEA